MPLARASVDFTSAIDTAVLERRVDLGVHSLKDVPPKHRWTQVRSDKSGTVELRVIEHEQDKGEKAEKADRDRGRQRAKSVWLEDMDNNIIDGLFATFRSKHIPQQKTSEMSSGEALGASWETPGG